MAHSWTRSRLEAIQRAAIWQQTFGLGVDLLEGVEAAAIEQQAQGAGSFSADCGTDGGSFVAGQIVHRDEVARPERREESQLGPGTERGSVDRLVKVK